MHQNVTIQRGDVPHCMLPCTIQYGYGMAYNAHTSARPRVRNGTRVQRHKETTLNERQDVKMINTLTRGPPVKTQNFAPISVLRQQFYLVYDWTLKVCSSMRRTTAFFLLILSIHWQYIFCTDGQERCHRQPCSAQVVLQTSLTLQVLSSLVLPQIVRVAIHYLLYYSWINSDCLKWRSGISNQLNSISSAIYLPSYLHSRAHLSTWTMS